MNEIFALDLGNKQTKLKSSKGEYRLPSHFLNANRTATIDYGQNETINKLDVNTFKLINEDSSYIWGKDVDKLGLQNGISGMIDTIGLGIDRYDKYNFQLLAKFAVALLAKDFSESQEAAFTVDVVTGLPSEDFNNSTILESLKKALKREHVVVVNGVTIHVKVENITFLPQAVGSVFKASFTNQIPNIENENILVADCGGGTMLIDTINNLQYNKLFTKQTELGAFNLYRSIIASMNTKKKPSEFQVAEIIRDGIKDNQFTYSINKHESVDITETIKKEIDEYTDDILNEIDTIATNQSNFDDIIFTGGGSNILNKKIVKERFPYATFLEDGEMANVQGFYQYGNNIR